MVAKQRPPGNTGRKPRRDAPPPLSMQPKSPDKARRPKQMPAPDPVEQVGENTPMTVQNIIRAREFPEGD
jgi:hypothetical protein